MRGKNRSASTQGASKVLQINAQRTIDFLYVVNRPAERRDSPRTDTGTTSETVFGDDDDDAEDDSIDMSDTFSTTSSDDVLAESHVFEKFDASDDAGADLFQAPESLRVRVSAVQFTLAFGFLAELGAYFTDLMHMHRLVQSTASAVGGAARDAATDLFADAAAVNTRLYREFVVCW